MFPLSAASASALWVSGCASFTVFATEVPEVSTDVHMVGDIHKAYLVDKVCGFFTVHFVS